MISPWIFILALAVVLIIGTILARRMYRDELIIELLPTSPEMVDWDALLKPMRDALNVFGLALEQLEPTMKQLGEIFAEVNGDIVEALPMRQDWKDQCREEDE